MNHFGGDETLYTGFFGGLNPGNLMMEMFHIMQEMRMSTSFNCSTSLPCEPSKLYLTILTPFSFRFWLARLSIESFRVNDMTNCGFSFSV